MNGQRFIALFHLGCALFNYPLLSLINKSNTVLGIPLVYAYVFASGPSTAASAGR
ncbi:MAG: hypothetical protein HY331_11400 [Chloroflexi bacterium]|nr:hypothetical protein [Chloroflexota bacterium]